MHVAHYKAGKMRNMRIPFMPLQMEGDNRIVMRQESLGRVNAELRHPRLLPFLLHDAFATLLARAGTFGHPFLV